MPNTAADGKCPFGLTSDPQRRLVLHRSGEEDVVDVRIRRAFPWSNVEHHLSIRDKDGKELVHIDDLHALPGRLADQVRDLLISSTLIPRILKVVSLNSGFNNHQWSVETDRGPASFVMQDKEDLRFLPDGRFTVKDANGNVYEIPREETLDRGSRKLLRALI